MRGWVGQTGTLSRWFFGAVVLVSAIAIKPSLGWCVYAPHPDELALLGYANRERAEHHLAPYVWNAGLGEAARAHSDDTTTHQCFQHDSCNGQAWWRRIQQYYPGWYSLAENIAGGGSDPRIVHEGWMASDGHRANILSGSCNEFGAGISVASPALGSWSYSTEDFGNRGAVSLDSIPTLPAGGAVPRLHYASEPRELFVNYYDHGGGAPQAIRALVGSTCVNLPRIAGSASNGTYGTTRTFSNLCTPVVFEAIRSDGTRVRWPEGKAIVVGVGAESVTCAEFTTSVPTQDCGGGGTLPPNPTPAPPPGPGVGQADNVHIVLKTGRSDASKGTVSIQAELPQLPDFDPTSTPISLSLGIGNSGDWSANLPATCGDEPCLKVNRKRTVYTAKYDGPSTITFRRNPDRSWKVRFSARNQTLEALVPGPVTLTLTVGGQTFTASALGELRENGLVAE